MEEKHIEEMHMPSCTCSIKTSFARYQFSSLEYSLAFLRHRSMINTCTSSTTYVSHFKQSFGTVSLIGNIRRKHYYQNQDTTELG